MPLHRFSASGLLTIVLLLRPAFAADEKPSPAPAPAPSKDEAKKQEKIEVQGNSLDQRRESTAAKSVVNHDELVQYGDTTLLDAVKRLPGVTVQGNSIRMRGLGAGYTQILVDGDPMPPGFSIETLSPDLIERIEIYRSATAEFSTQAIAGTINIVLRKAVSQRRREAKVSTSVMNGEPSAYMTAQYADRAGPLSFTLPFSLNAYRYRSSATAEQRGWDAAGIPDLDYVTLSQNAGNGANVGFTPKLSWSWGKDHTLLWETFFNASRNHGEFAERSTPVLGELPPYASDILSYDAASGSVRTGVTWNRHLANDARVEVKAALNYNRRSSEAVFDAYDAQDVYVLHRTVDGHANDEGASVKGKYVFPFVPDHSFVTGWDVQFSRRREDRLQNDVTPTGLPIYDIDESYDARVLQLAAFAQDEWQVTERTSAYFGLRWEGIDTRSVGNTVDEVSTNSGVWSPIVQGLWKLPGTEKDQLRAGLARTYKAPNTFQLIPRRYIANNNTPTTPDFQGNPALKPELAWGLDAAYEHYFTGGGLFSISAYGRRIQDVILSELLELDGTFITRPANEGSATAKGIELDTKFGLANLVPSAPAIDVHANLSRHWSHVDQLPGPDNRLARQNRWSANAGLDYKWAPHALTVGTSFTLTTGGPVRTSLTQTAYSSVRRSLDAYALWKLSAHTQVRLFASNLLAQENLQIERYGGPDSTLELTTINPGYRTVGLSLEFKE